MTIRARMRAQDGSGAQGPARSRAGAPSNRQRAQAGPGVSRSRGPEACGDCQVEPGVLTAAQEDSLAYMANEEKLAHDVYAALGALYDAPIFERIAAAEAQHQAAVQHLLERYQIEGSPYAMTAGTFTDTTISDLFESLLARGSDSLAEAIAVGILIEETDIADLEAQLGGLETDEPGVVTAPDVYQVYSNLLRASQRHLEAFQGMA